MYMHINLSIYLYLGADLCRLSHDLEADVCTLKVLGPLGRSFGYLGALGVGLLFGVRGLEAKARGWGIWGSWASGVFG